MNAIKVNDYIGTLDTSTSWDITYGSTSKAATLADALSSYCTVADKATISNVIDSTMTPRQPEVSPETKTKLANQYGKIYVKHYKDGYYQKQRQLMPDFKDIKVVQKTVIVEWTDGTKTKTSLDSEDTYSLEQGISICITKKLLGEEGSSVYNKLIKRALKIKAANEAAVAKAKQEKKEAKERKLRYEEKRRAKKLRKREEAIEIQKEAYLRAMRELEPTKE